jgi:hypothetical protein
MLVSDDKYRCLAVLASTSLSQSLFRSRIDASHAASRDALLTASSANDVASATRAADCIVKNNARNRHIVVVVMVLVLVVVVLLVVVVASVI